MSVWMLKKEHSEWTFQLICNDWLGKKEGKRTNTTLYLGWSGEVLETNPLIKHSLK